MNASEHYNDPFQVQKEKPWDDFLLAPEKLCHPLDCEEPIDVELFLKQKPEIERKCSR